MSNELNMLEIPLDKFIKEVRDTFKEGDYSPIIGLGKSGIGKTVSMKSLAKQLGVGYKEMRLVTLQETDMLGMPVVKDGQTTYASNAQLPREDKDGETGLFVLDEVTSASPNLRAAAYQLMDSQRALGNYKLPPKWKIVALGNGIDDGGVFNGVESAFLTRGTSGAYRVTASANAWREWAAKNGANPTVLAYLWWKPDAIWDMDMDSVGELFASPRTWEALSNRLNSREKANGGPVDPDDVYIWAGGLVGERIAAEFSGYYSYNSKKSMLSPEEILNGSAAKLDGGGITADTDRQVVYLTVQNTIAQLRKDVADYNCDEDNVDPKVVNEVANLLNWFIAVSDVGLDYALTGISDLTDSIPIVSDVILSEEFDDVCPRFLPFATEKNIMFTSY